MGGGLRVFFQAKLRALGFGVYGARGGWANRVHARDSSCMITAGFRLRMLFFLRGEGGGSS